MFNETLVIDSIKEADEHKLKEIFYIACRYDDCYIIKKYIEMQLIDPCENGFSLLKYAIEKRCVKIVAEILNSNFFINLPMDTKAAIQVAANTGDSGFALYMLN